MTKEVYLMKILNFGSLNIDYVYSVEHFVRAGETLASDRLELFAGGKGLNQSVALARAGAEVYHAGLIGAEGSLLRDMLTRSGADTRFVRTLSDTPCGHAIIQVSSAGENCILLHGGANHRVTEEMMDEVLSFFDRGDLLVLQNEINGLSTLIRKAKDRGLTVALNPSPFNQIIAEVDLSLIDWLILNETEGRDMTGEADTEGILSSLLTRNPDIRIVLTLGGDGALYADRAARIRQAIFPATVVDTTAAGDTFTGFFFASITSGGSPEDALRLASAAASVTVSRKGAAPSIPTLDEVTSLKKL